MKYLLGLPNDILQKIADELDMEQADFITYWEEGSQWGRVQHTEED
jgi:hypothetical protein